MVYQDGIRKINEDAQCVGMFLASNHEAGSKSREEERAAEHQNSAVDQWKLFIFTFELYLDACCRI